MVWPFSSPPVSLSTLGVGSSWEEPALASEGSQQGTGLGTSGLFCSLKLAQFEQHQSPQEVPAPSWGEHQGLGGTRGVWGEVFSSQWHRECACRERTETDVSSLRLFPLSLQDSLGAGPGKGIAVGQEGRERLWLQESPTLSVWEGEAPSQTRKEL